MVDGVWSEEPGKIKKEIENFYKKVFLEANNDRPTYVNSRVKTLTVEEANSLEVQFSENEIWEVVRDCESSKAPGPDGFNFRFIKKFWDVIKGDLIAAVLWFGENAVISKGCNASFVSLIPKVNDPLGLGDFRPISLIGCYYKIVSKILAERLKKVVGKLVGEVQNAFIGGRYILANETVAHMKKSKKNCLVFKVNFEKAYDCLNWNYLINLMKYMGFRDKWCRWIEACLSSASISILVNGSPTEEFFMSRGVRQGDPLSPFLFILPAEGLNGLMCEAVHKGIFNGVKVGRDEVCISLLQYADDTIFFGEWSRLNVGNLMSILKCFEELSGAWRHTSFRFSMPGHV